MNSNSTKAVVSKILQNGRNQNPAICKTQMAVLPKAGSETDKTFRRMILGVIDRICQH
jgi:hypothetical protein